MGGKTDSEKPKRREVVFRVGFTKRSAQMLEQLANAQSMFAPQYIRELCEAHMLSKRQTVPDTEGKSHEDALREEMIALNSELMRIAGIRDDKKRMLDREVRKRLDGVAESEVWREVGDGYESVEGWECEFDEDDEDNPAKKPAAEADDADSDEFDWSVPIQG